MKISDPFSLQDFKDDLTEVIKRGNTMQVSDNPTCEVIAQVENGERMPIMDYPIPNYRQPFEDYQADMAENHALLEEKHAINAALSIPTDPMSDQQLRMWAWEQFRHSSPANHPTEQHWTEVFKEEIAAADRLIQWVKGEE